MGNFDLILIDKMNIYFFMASFKYFILIPPFLRPSFPFFVLLK